MKSLIVLMISQVAWGQILLVPDPTVLFDDYKNHCVKVGYVCTMTFALQKAEQMDSPKFNLLINELDYSSELYREQFLSHLFKSIREENLSIDQIEISIKILEKMREFSDAKMQKNYQLVENQLNELLNLVKSNELTELPERFLIILKKPIAINAVKKWSLDQLKFKIDLVDFNRAPFEIKLAGDDKKNGEQLVTGFCDGTVIHPSIQAEKWSIDSDTPCGFAAHFSKMKNSAANMISDNKYTLFTAGLIVVGASIFLSQYEVKFNF